MNVATLEQEVLRLSEGDRAILAEALLSSLCTAEDSARLDRWAEESDSRIAAFEAGELEAEGSDVVLARLRSRVNS